MELFYFFILDNKYFVCYSNLGDVMSIYIHIPFCTSICTYCDFCKIIYNEKYISNYLDMLEKEIRERYKGEKVKTIFIGGGTPTSLSLDELKRLFDIIKIFNVEDIIEYTIESNVESIDEDKLILMKEYGINRISIGVESFDNNTLKVLGRSHNKEDIFNKIELVKKYFDNINIDLIYAAYNDINILKRDIDYFLKLDIPHISTYSLIIEDNTMLKINGTKNINEDLDYEMYKYIEKTLEDNNYKHYEISNYAKEGYESKHNLVYWNNDYYYGFGLSSTSYIDNIRSVNTKNLTKYLNGNYKGTEEKEDINTRMENEIMLGFRKLDGINIGKFRDRYGKDVEDVFDIDDLVRDNYLIKEDNYLRINKEYMYISNEIISRIFN